MRLMARFFVALAVASVLWGIAYGLTWLGHAYGDALLIGILFTFTVVVFWVSL